jgi:hypothetical protein
MSEEGSRHSSDAPSSGLANAMGGGASGAGGTRNNVVVKIGMVGDAQVSRRRGDHKRINNLMFNRLAKQL